ncbi:MAG TPA: ATP-binding protein [Steroidobacteraceae bacterium]|jgi:CheY-like chemotaxis protein|nr:ATP-binding protein [Steroidobacteraceae bacterium]
MNQSIDELLAALERERAARTEAERTGRLKDEFLEALAHELRAPLNAILGWSRLLEHGHLGDRETRSGGQTIARNARALAHIVDDLLDLSAITSGKIRVDAEETDLCEIVEAAVELQQEHAAAKGVSLGKTFETRDCVVFGEPQRLQQIVWHLLSNAIKFTPRGGHAHITVRSIGGYCDIEVKDTGAGIASDLLPYVFDRFWRADSCAEHRYAGLGLGLALAKRLAELHGGTVTATSPGPNQGATFTVVVPRVAPRDRQPDEAIDVRPELADNTAARRSDVAAQTDLSGLRVLVVDDEPDTLDLLRRVLGDSRAQVAAAPSVEAALATLDGFEPHVLISDVSMPGRDGYELIKAVRTRTSSERLPAAALTAYTRPDDADRAHAAGFQVHLAKPIEPEQLVKMVARLAGRLAGRA